MRKSLIVTVLTSTVVFSTHVMAGGGVMSNLQAEIEVDHSGDIEADAKNFGGNNNNVNADAGVVIIKTKANERTNIVTKADLDIEVRSRGDIEAEARNQGGSNNNVSATAAVVSIITESGQ
ncbi:MAG: hypothetical protein DRR19_23885 [Candidatus Parabeggiatoa sp. nov. 1]|nr:MAG: hypothetical protein DRR19_23885 [Gammaproteobacteria bacterium]